MDAPPNAVAEPEPQPPQAPDPLECCQSGCDPCVYDRYWEAVTRYEEARRAWAARQDPIKT